MREQFYEFKFSTRVWNTNIYTRSATSTSKNQESPAKCSRKNIFFLFALVRAPGPRKNSL